MASLRNHHSGQFVKLLLMGDAKSGKTTSLISLVKAGYKLRILDMDNLLDSLSKFVMRDCPELADNVEYRTLRDERTATTSGMVIKGTPSAYTQAIRLLDRWKYDDVDLGSPAEWGPDCVLVIDSLSRLCDAAYDWREALAPRGATSGKSDGRAIYGDAQDTIESVLAGLTSSSFGTNVIVIAHIQYMSLPDGTQKGFPQGVGQKLSPKIPQYFGTVVYYANKHDKRTMFTASTALIDLCNPMPFAISETYPTDIGLAELFRIIKGGEPCSTEVTSQNESSSIKKPNVGIGLHRRIG